MPEADDESRLHEARSNLAKSLGELAGSLEGLEDGDVPPEVIAAIERMATEAELLVEALSGPPDGRGA